MKTQIAMIGNADAGKTVLLTTLAQRLMQGEFRGTRLIPVNTDSNPRGAEQTMQYTSEIWDRLNASEWIPSTEQGKLVECSWNLIVHGVREAIPFHDMAGQDLTLFPFKVKTPDEIAQLSSMERTQYERNLKIVDYVRQSSVILVLINLRLFLNEPDANIRRRNQMQVLSALNDAIKSGQHHGIAFVLPQWDQYDYTINNEYGGSCYKFLKKELPLIYHEFIAGKFGVGVFPVAAVADTVYEDRDNDGIDEIYPMPGFKSTGLSPLVRWIGRCTVPLTVRVCYWVFAIIALILSLVIAYHVGPYLGGGIGNIVRYIWCAVKDGALSGYGDRWEFSDTYWTWWSVLGRAGLGLCSIFAAITGAEFGKKCGRKLDAKLNRPLYTFFAWCYEKISWLWV